MHELLEEQCVCSLETRKARMFWLELAVIGEKDSAFQNGLFAVVQIWLMQIIPLSYCGCLKKVALVQWNWFQRYMERTFNYKHVNEAVSPCTDWF